MAERELKNKPDFGDDKDSRVDTLFGAVRT